METKKLKIPQKGAGARLRELSKKRREGMKPSKELLEILQNPEKVQEQDKKSALPVREKESEI